MYGDDSCTIAPSPAGLQIMMCLYQCSMYADSHTIVCNEIKTKCMCFTLKPFHNILVPTLFVGKPKLTFVKEVKYLGVIINDDMNDKIC